MNLQALDAASTRVAAAVLEAIPALDWISVTSDIRVAPHGQTADIQFAYTLRDGRVDRATSPRRGGDQAVHQAALDHWRLAQSLGQPRWYRMTVKVDRNGKYTLDFEYRDDYREGDLDRPSAR